MATSCKRCEEVGHNEKVGVRDFCFCCRIWFTDASLMSGQRRSDWLLESLNPPPFSVGELTALRKRWLPFCLIQQMHLLLMRDTVFASGLSQWLTVFGDPDAPTLVDIEDSLRPGCHWVLMHHCHGQPQVYPEKVKHRKLDASEFIPLQTTINSSGLIPLSWKPSSEKRRHWGACTRPGFLR